MKKKISNAVTYTKDPPPGWPTEDVWAAIEQEFRKKSSVPLPSGAGPVQRAKHELCEKFIIYVDAQDITQRELARRLDVGENRVSEILHYEYDSFTIDRLVELLSRIKPNVRIQVA